MLTDNLKVMPTWYHEHPSPELRAKIINDWLEDASVPDEIKDVILEELAELRDLIVDLRQ
jgi:hypothetical protein